MAAEYSGNVVHQTSTGQKMVAHTMVTTQFELDGFRVTRTLGVVRGIVVRSRSIFGTIGAGLQTLVGGNITLLTNLCENGEVFADCFDGSVGDPDVGVVKNGVAVKHARLCGSRRCCRCRRSP